MKKGVVILSMLLVASVFATAQKMDLGIKAGYLYSDVKAKEIQSFDGAKSRGKNGYFIGLFGRIGGDRWFFQPGLEYRVRTADIVTGKEIIESGIKKDSKLEVSMKTLDVPLQVGISLLNLSLVKVYAHTGPVVSIKIDNSTSATDVVKDFKFDDYNDYKSLVWAGQIGVSADIMRFSVDISYEKGFSDIGEKGMGTNDLFMVSLGMKIF